MIDIVQNRYLALKKKYVSFPQIIIGHYKSMFVFYPVMSVLLSLTYCPLFLLMHSSPSGSYLVYIKLMGLYYGFHAK